MQALASPDASANSHTNSIAPAVWHRVREFGSEGVFGIQMRAINPQVVVA